MKPLALAGVFLIGCVAADPPPKLPVPAGPFGIGRIGYDWVDQSRPDRHATDTQAHRELMVYLWYPSSQKRADDQGAYLPGAKQMDASPDIRVRRAFGVNWPAIVSGAIFSHAVERAPVAKSPPRFPVVVFSHGGLSMGFYYTSLIEDLTSRGYVVAAIEHEAVWFPDGRIIPFHEESPPAGLSSAEKYKWIGAQVSAGVNEGAADVRFVVDRLTGLNSGNAEHFLLAGRLDLNRVAAMGHSAGAEFAARACQLDARFQACVDLDGGMVPIAALPLSSDGSTPPMKSPLLFLEANHPESQMGGTHAQHEEYFRKKEEQLRGCRPGSYDVVLQSAGIEHGSFSDIPLLAAGSQDHQVRIALHNLDLAHVFIRAFLDKNLREQKAPLLDGDSVPLEVTIQRYGQ